jgi:hypothetical protein
MMSFKQWLAEGFKVDKAKFKKKANAGHDRLPGDDPWIAPVLKAKGYDVTPLTKKSKKIGDLTRKAYRYNDHDYDD